MVKPGNNCSRQFSDGSRRFQDLGGNYEVGAGGFEAVLGDVWEWENQETFASKCSRYLSNGCRSGNGQTTHTDYIVFSNEVVP